MSSYYFDSSAFLNIKFQEDGSSRMMSLVQGVDPHISEYRGESLATVPKPFL